MKIYKASQEMSTDYDSEYSENMFSDSPIELVKSEINELQIEIERNKKILSIPDNTCPLIDEVISSCKEAEKHAMSIQKTEDIEECHSLANDIEYDINLEFTLEEIRKANSDLRDLGLEWYNFSKEAIRSLERIKKAL